MPHRNHTQAKEVDDADGTGQEPAGFLSLQVLSESDTGEVADDVRNPEAHLKTGRLKKMRTKRLVELPSIRKKAVPDNGTKCQTPAPMSPADNVAALCCKVCQVLRGSANMLIKHAWSHVDDLDQLCGVCGERAKSLDDLRTHLHGHQKTSNCNICGKSFLSVNGLRGHIARHNGQKPHKCKVCHKAFAQKWVLKNHMWIHETEKPHKCEFCPKSFASKVDLTRHRVSHTRESLHRCNTCGKSLSSLEVLSRHLLKHSDQTQFFSCDVCGTKCSTKQKLLSHARVHAKTRSFRCPICNRAFSQSHCVKRHMRSLHGVSEPDKTDASLQNPSVNSAKSIKHVR